MKELAENHGSYPQSATQPVGNSSSFAPRKVTCYEALARQTDAANMDRMTSEHPESDLPIADDGTMPVPVYDCHVILSVPDNEGVIHARVANLPKITVSGRNEREILQKIVKDFKAALIRYRTDGVEIPWGSPQSPGEDERQRWIPVHL